MYPRHVNPVMRNFGEHSTVPSATVKSIAMRWKKTVATAPRAAAADRAAAHRQHQHILRRHSRVLALLALSTGLLSRAHVSMHTRTSHLVTERWACG